MEMKNIPLRPAEASASTSCPGLFSKAISDQSYVDLLASQPQVVFVVCDGEYEDYEIKGVFSSFKEAREFQEEHDFEHMEFHVLDEGNIPWSRIPFVIKMNEKGKGIIEEYNRFGVLVNTDTVNCSFIPDLSQPVVNSFLFLKNRHEAEVVAEGLFSEWNWGKGDI